VVSGNIDASLMFGAEAESLAESGKIRVIAATDPIRNPRYTTVPTLAKLVGESFDLPGWAVLAAPAATPADIVSKMRDAINSALVTEPYKSWSERPGAIPSPVLDAAALKQFLAQQKRDVAEIVKRANLKAE
jgi:tripartite-type tricarboxylate transporter receptor subunit TctC